MNVNESSLSLGKYKNGRKQFNTKKEEETRRNSRGNMRVKVFTFRSYKLTQAHRRRHTQHIHIHSPSSMPADPIIELGTG